MVGDKRPNYQWLRAYKEYPGGQVYSVQLDPNEIPGIEEMGVTNFKSLLDVPDPVDYVLCAVPRRITPRIIADCIKKNVGIVACYTAGFAETHEPEGIELQETLTRMAREAGLNLVGPNCLGINNLRAGLRGGAVQIAIPDGYAGVVSMSGTHTGNLTNTLNTHGIPVSKAVSMGNGIAVDQADWLEYMGQDDSIRIIAMYLEGVGNGRKFFNALKEVAARKPVIILKGGQTADGARAATSHTASLASPWTVWEGMFKQCGAIGVDSIDEAGDVAKVLMMAKPIRGSRMGIIAGTGGLSVLVSDAAARYGLSVPPLTERSYEMLRPMFSLTGNSYRNPLDVTATLTAAEQGQRMLDILAADDNIDILAMEVGDLQGGRGQQQDFGSRMVEIFQGLKERSPKPFLVIQSGMEDVVLKTREALRGTGIPSVYSFLRATLALRRARDYYLAQDEIRTRAPARR